mgnify:CR=1 FL=1
MKITNRTDSQDFILGQPTRAADRRSNDVKEWMNIGGQIVEIHNQNKLLDQKMGALMVQQVQAEQTKMELQNLLAKITQGKQSMDQTMASLAPQLSEDVGYPANALPPEALGESPNQGFPNQGSPEQGFLTQGTPDQGIPSQYNAPSM